MESWSSEQVRALRTCLIVGVLCLSLLVFRSQGAQQDAHVISSTGTITTSRNLGWLHIDGRWIKDSTGKTLHFVGCAESQTSWSMPTPTNQYYWNDALDPIPMATRMAELGVTWVRICITYTFWSDPTFGNDYKSLIDNFVNEFTSRGIYCIISPMGDEFANDVPNNPTPWLNFLTELANRYKNNPGMCGISIWNEPPFTDVALDVWRQWAILGAQAVNAANPNLLIIVSAGLPNEGGIDPYWASNPLPVPNVVYDYHNYPWHYWYYSHYGNGQEWRQNLPPDFQLSYAAGNYTLAKQQMEAFFYPPHFKYAVEHNMCIMNEEFGFAEGNNPNVLPGETGYDPGFPQCAIDYFDLLNKYSISWNYYCWWVGGYGLTSDGVNLNIVGQIWSQYLGPP